MGKPEFTLEATSYARHQDNDSFWTVNDSRYPFPNFDKQEKVRLSEAELTKQRAASYQRALAGE